MPRAKLLAGSSLGPVALSTRSHGVSLLVARYPIPAPICLRDLVVSTPYWDCQSQSISREAKVGVALGSGLRGFLPTYTAWLRPGFCCPNPKAFAILPRGHRVTPLPHFGWYPSPCVCAARCLPGRTCALHSWPHGFALAGTLKK